MRVYRTPPLLLLTVLLVGCGSSNPVLIDAILQQDSQRVASLVSSGHSANQQSENGVTALSFAARQNNLAIARVLLDQGANPSNGGSAGYPPLYAAVQEGASIEMVRLLLDAGAEVDKGWTSGWTPLLAAARYASPEVASLLLERGASLDARNSFGLSALHLAVFRESRDMADLLMQQGASIHVRNNDGLDVLQYSRDKNSSVTPEFLQQRYQTYQAEISRRVATESQQQLLNQTSQRMAEIEARDSAMAAEFRRDKYLVAFSNNMKQLNYADAVLYAGLLERVGLPVDDSLYYFWGEALLQLGQPTLAIEKLNRYLNLAGNSGQYYTQTLNLILQAESQ